MCHRNTPLENVGVAGANMTLQLDRLPRTPILWESYNNRWIEALGMLIENARLICCNFGACYMCHRNTPVENVGVEVQCGMFLY